ncbi:MAG: aminoacyl-tRNA hydrolase [bacterium]|nr:aminoacyl-tRNA hydrolase [bacterium]
MYLIVCLGNTGKKYEKTRHNLGFIAANYIIKNFELIKTGNKFKSILYEGTAGPDKIFLVKPQTYMNNSGEAVQLIKGFYKIPLHNIILIFDDIDLPFGTIRVRKKGSGGTHNGIKSVISLLGSNNFPRIRIGIGPVPHKWDITNFVLSNFTKEEEKLLPEICKKSVLEIDRIITQPDNTSNN